MSRSFIIWLMVILTGIFIWQALSIQRPKEKEIIFSQFVDAVDSGKVASVTIQGNEISGTFQDGTVFKTFAPNDPDLVKTLRDKGSR